MGVAGDQGDAFPRALQHARTERRLSQRELSRALSVSHSAVSQWESGRVRPIPAKVAELEQVLDLEPGSLSRLLGYLPIATANARASLSVLEAIRADPRLGDRERELLIAMYRQLVRQREAGAASE
jgi:transcriptional regulator with XRE-family HTH domain